MVLDPLSRELEKKYEDTIAEIFLDDRILNYQELFELWQSDFYMITAANPFSQLLTDDENEKRNQLLFDSLCLDHLQILSAVGRSPDGGWKEEGWIVIADNESNLIALAQKFEQNAIFKFSSLGKEVISCL